MFYLVTPVRIPPRPGNVAQICCFELVLFCFCFDQNISVFGPQMKGCHDFSSILRTLEAFILKSLEIGIQICGSATLHSLALGDGRWLFSPHVEPWPLFFDYFFFTLHQENSSSLKLTAQYSTLACIMYSVHTCTHACQAFLGALQNICCNNGH